MAKKKAKKFSVGDISGMIDTLSEETRIIIENEEDAGFIDTGVHIMNALISKSIKTGGVPSDRITIFAGLPGTGKSYLLYNLAKNAQKDGYFVLFIDTEHSINKHILNDFGVKTGPNDLKLITSTIVEDLKVFLTNFLDGMKTAKDEGAEVPKMIIFLDSIGQLGSDKEKNDALSGNNKQDMTRAKSIKQMFRIINADLGYLGIPLVATNHVYEDTTSFFPTQIMAGGKGVEYSASTVIFLSKAKLKTGREDELDLGATGVIITAQARKNRMARPKKVKFEIDYDNGTNTFKGLEYFCTPENYEKVGIAKGKKVENDDGTIGINPGGTRWYVRHLDKSFFEKQLFTKAVFTEDVINELEPIIYKYFDYASFDEEQEDVVDLNESENKNNFDADFDSIDSDDLFS